MRVSYSGTRRPKPCAPRADHDLYEIIEEDAVYDVMGLPPGTVVVHGAEPTGIDAAVGRAARELGLTVEEHPPDLAAHGGDFRRAALARNVYVTTVGADGEEGAQWAAILAACATKSSTLKACFMRLHVRQHETTFPNT